MLSPSLILLIAETDSRLKSFSGGFRRDRAQFDSSDIVLFVTGMGAVFGILWLLARWSERRVRGDSSLGLFWTLAKTHGVDWSDRWLLWRIARTKGLAETALLFLDPRLTSPRSVEHLAPQAAARLKILRRRLFFGIDRVAETPDDATVPETGPSLDQPTATDTGPAAAFNRAAQKSPETPTGLTDELAEAFAAIQSLKLEDQFVQPREPRQTPSGDEPEESPPHQTPSASFPALDAPVLDLYPWLGNDWEIKNDDQ